MISADWLAHRAISSPNRVALIYGGRQWQYAELNERVAAMAGRLQAAGVRTGNHVAVLMPNCPEYVCVIHALTRLGAVLVPLNLRLTPGELHWQIVAADCAFLLCSQDTQALAVAVAEHRLAMDHAELRVLSVDGLQPAERRLDPRGASPTSAEGWWEGRPPDLEAVQGIIFTSGTTGRPKGAMLTYGNHLASATASAFRLGTLPEDRWLVCMPLYHVGGLAIVLRCCLYGTTVVLQKRFDPDEVNRALDAQAVTLVSLVPTMLRRLLEARGSRPSPESLRCILVGGAPVPAALLEQSLALGMPVATTYGLTEAASQVATASPANVRRKAGANERELGHFVGSPLMFSQVRILDDDGSDEPVGQVGEIAVRGPAVMKGYYRQPEATDRTLRDGWLRTGDMGYLDHDGDLWIVQRRLDLIVTGGENVYPAEVESVLCEHPQVEDACVVGVPDEKWGQRVAAAIVVKAGATLSEEELAAFCAGRLAGYKRPRLFRFVESLPLTASGKVHRKSVSNFLFDVRESGRNWGHM